MLDDDPELSPQASPPPTVTAPSPSEAHANKDTVVNEEETDKDWDLATRNWPAKGQEAMGVF